MDDSVNEYVDFLDFIMCGNLMSEQEDSHLYQLLKTFQIHSHSKTCPKYKNMKCRLKFGRSFTAKTIVARPLQKMLSHVEKFEILNKRSNILCKVKNYIDINLDPSNKLFSNYKSIREILSSIEIAEDDYYWHFLFHLKLTLKCSSKEAQVRILSTTITQFYLRHGKRT